MLRRAPGLYVLITLVYAPPALVAGIAENVLREPSPWQQAMKLALSWITIVLGAVVVMVAVGYHARGRTVDLGGATRLALRWTPRYVWTNVHTSLIFWVPTGLLVAIRQWQAQALPLAGPSDVAAGCLWWLVIVGVALYLHTRTLLAPFFAVHADLPGTLAFLEAWRLSGHHFSLCFATFVLGTLPVAVPLVLLMVLVARSLSAAAQDAMITAAPDLAWAGIQTIRPVLIPAVYWLYRDLWKAEEEHRQREGQPRVPGPLRLVLALTQPLPKPGRWD